MRRFRAAFMSLAILAAAQSPAIADPVQAPGAAVQIDPLLLTVDHAIAVTKQRNLDFQVHTPWQIMHGLLALRNNYTLKNGNEFVNAIDFISTQATYKGKRWFERTPAGGKAQPYNGTPYDFEGHVNQTLSIIAMCDLPLTHKFVLADGSTVTMADMIRHAQWNVTAKEEITWTLWLLTHYLDQDAKWTNFEGEQWSMERLVRIQTAASPYNAPCGGCHGLFAMAYARNAYLQKHGRLQGAWLEADQKLQQYVTAAQTMMNRDGSFATQYFKARGYSTNFNERIASSGHMIEWLMLALPRKRLDEGWLRLGVQTLANDLIRNATQPADCGPLYHSLHALILYKQRMQPNFSPNSEPELALKPGMSAGPLSQGTPDGSEAPRKLSVEANPVANTKPATPAMPQPNATVSVEPQTSPAAQSTAPEKANPQEPVKAPEPKGPVQVAEEPRPISMTPQPVQTLKPASSAEAPTLVSPPTLAGPTLKPAADTPVKTLSGDTTTTAGKAEQAEGAKAESAPEPDAKSLTPVAGGMPILKPSAPVDEEKAKAGKTPAETTKSADEKTAEPKSETQKSEPKPTSTPKLEAPAADAKSDVTTDSKKADEKGKEAEPAAQDVAEPKK